MITPEDYQIILQLESNPLLPYSDLANELGVSWPTAKKRLTDLKSRGVIRTPVAIYDIRALGLQRLSIMWSIKTVDDLLLLEKFCDIHPYTHYRARGYGNGYVLFAQFDVPHDIIPLMNELIETLEKENDSVSTDLFQSSGYRAESFSNLRFYNLNQNMWTFDWTSWLELIDNQPDNLPPQDDSKPTELSEWTRIDFEILRELTKDPEIKQSELMRKFNLTRTNTHVRYNTIFDKLISSVRCRFDRILFNLVNARLFWIPHSKEKKINQLYNLMKASPPPFNFGMDILEEKGLLFWGVALPTFHEHQLASSIWKLFQDFNTYTLDTSIDRSIVYWFYPANFDFDTHYWKIDREYVVEKPLEELYQIK